MIDNLTNPWLSAASGSPGIDPIELNIRLLIMYRNFALKLQEKLTQIMQAEHKMSQLSTSQDFLQNLHFEWFCSVARLLGDTCSNICMRPILFFSKR